MRRAFGILALALLPTGCAGLVTTTDPTAARAALDEYIINFWMKRDTKALDRALSPTMVYHYNGHLIPGDPAAHAKALRGFGSAFPDLAATVDVFTVSGSIGAAATTWSGTHTGVLCQTPGTGKKVSWAVNYVFTVSQGRIVELWETWDPGSLHKQLGIDGSKCG